MTIKFDLAPDGAARRPYQSVDEHDSLRVFS
jgi:hypothetical protein